MPDGFQTLSAPYHSETRFVCDSLVFGQWSPASPNTSSHRTGTVPSRSGPILPILRENWHYFERIRLAGWNWNVPSRRLGMDHGQTGNPTCL